MSKEKPLKRCQCDEFMCDMSGCYEFVYPVGSSYIGDWCNRCEYKHTCAHLESKRSKAKEKMKDIHLMFQVKSGA